MIFKLKKKSEMKKITMERTDITPLISYDQDNRTLTIKGRSYPEDADTFYAPLINWIEELERSPFRQINISILLEYVNTSSTKALVNALHKLEKVSKTMDSQVLISWHYLEYDEEIQETGQMLKSLIDLPFKFVEVPTN